MDHTRADQAKIALFQPVQSVGYLQRQRSPEDQMQLTVGVLVTIVREFVSAAALRTGACAGGRRLPGPG